MRSFIFALCVCLTLAVICSSTNGKKLSKKDDKVKRVKAEEDENDGPPKVPDPSKVIMPEEGSAEKEDEKSGPELHKENMEKLKQKIKDELMKGMSGKKTHKRVEMEPDTKKAYDTMKQIMVRLMLISKVTLATIPIGHLVGIFFTLLDTSVKTSGNIWDQIKDQVDAKISQAISRYHFDTTIGDFTAFQTMAELKKENFDIDDLVEIIAAKHNMLAFNFRDLGYSEELATLLPTWTLFMTTAYLQLITNGVITDRCALAKEMAKLRVDTIKNAKSLFRKRYQKLDGTRSQKRHPDHHCIGTSCYFAYHLTFTDRFNGKEKEQLISNVENIFENIQAEVTESLMKVMVEPINEFFNPDICLEGCDCPAPITSSEISFEYPSSCYGTTVGDGGCTLPCDEYSETYLWCPYYPYRNAYAYRKHQYKIGDRWDYCRKNDWNECMPIE